MKCPECQNQHAAKLGQTCGRCGYKFVFNPKSTDSKGMTDGKFLGLIKKVSQDDTQFFTRNQLYSTYCRSLKSFSMPLIFSGLFFATLGGGLCFAIPSTGAKIMLGFGVLLLMIGAGSAEKAVSPAKFQQYVDKFHGTGKPIEKLITEPKLHQPPPDWKEPDIYDYGVERLLIVERDLLVDLFVKNELHAEQRMLVLSENGYPEYLLPIARKLLDERPDLPVFLLHDATLEGLEMQDRLMSSGLLPLENHPITDLGLAPKDFQKLARTKSFDPSNTERTLPVDALMMPFLIGGMGAAFAGGLALSDLLAAEQPTYEGGGGFDFG